MNAELGRRVLQRAGVYTFDPVTIAIVVQAIIQAIQLIQECRSNPTAEDVLEFCNNPNPKRRQKILIRWWVRTTLRQADIHDLPVSAVVDAGLIEVAQLPQSDIEFALSSGGRQ